MAYTKIPYRGGERVDPPTLVNDGGQYVEDNLVELLTRTGPKYIGVGAPTANDDSANTSGRGPFYDLSRWIQTDAPGGRMLWTCLDDTPGAAVWASEQTQPAGPDGAVQYNNGGDLGGEAEFVWDDVAKRLTIQGDATVADTLIANIGAFADHVSWADATFVPTSSSIWSDDAGNLSFYDNVAAQTYTLTELAAMRLPAGPDRSVQFNDGGLFGGEAALSWENNRLETPAVRHTPQAAPPYESGLVWYDSTKKALSLYVDEPNVALQIGEELWAKVRNNSGATIPNGTPVYVSGSQGNLPTIALAQANVSATARVAGVTTQDIPNNGDGYVTVFGLVRDLNTSGYNEGDILYLSDSVAGGYTTTPPAAPSYRMRIAAVMRSHASLGELIVRPYNIDPTRESTMDSLDILNDLTVGGDVTITGSLVGDVTITGNLEAVDGLFHGTLVSEGNFYVGDPALAMIESSTGKAAFGIGTVEATDWLHVRVPASTAAGIRVDNPAGDNIRIGMDTIGRSVIVCSTSTTYSTPNTMTITGNSTVVDATAGLNLGDNSGSARFFSMATGTPYLYLGGYHTGDGVVRNMWALSNTAGAGYWIAYGEMRLCSNNSTGNRFIVDVGGDAGNPYFSRKIFAGPAKQFSVEHNSLWTILNSGGGVQFSGGNIGVNSTPSTDKGAGFFYQPDAIPPCLRTRTQTTGPMFIGENASAIEQCRIDADGTAWFKDYKYHSPITRTVTLTPVGEPGGTGGAVPVEYQPGVIGWTHSKNTDQGNWFYVPANPATIDNSGNLTFTIAAVYDGVTGDTVEFGVDLTIVQNGATVPATVQALSGPVNLTGGVVTSCEVTFSLAGLTAPGQLSFKVFRNRGGPNDTLNQDITALGYYASVPVLGV